MPSPTFREETGKRYPYHPPKTFKQERFSLPVSGIFKVTRAAGTSTYTLKTRNGKELNWKGKLNDMFYAVIE